MWLSGAVHESWVNEEITRASFAAPQHAGNARSRTQGHHLASPSGQWADLHRSKWNLHGRPHTPAEILSTAIEPVGHRLVVQLRNQRQRWLDPSCLTLRDCGLSWGILKNWSAKGLWKTWLWQGSWGSEMGASSLGRSKEPGMMNPIQIHPWKPGMEFCWQVATNKAMN